MDIRRYDNRVVVMTRASGGIGRQHAGDLAVRREDRRERYRCELGLDGEQGR
ncbi:hypothetical protein SH591_11380 [Sphingomonas sp. LY54]|uniref:hypothetical protein n=1 Tax=Sphingomonadales TaxID=204457 RepID=UPI002ADEF9AF|nr:MULTISPECIES: hypothetical protein [Sphingomonadales]MEA1015266.1 hypothetical protein [Sphingosinicella sp. LY1275]WRP27705.1 hypothetical protein SH591_11380 [Sphingomonas sp. LY54]